MTNSRGALSLATAVLLLVAGTSCADDDGDPTDPRSNPPASSPSSSSSTPTSPSESATAAATATVNDYYAIRNQLRRDPTQPLSRLKSVAISTELTTQQTLFKRERKQGLHQTGETKVVELQVQSVNLDNSDPQAGKVPTVQIDVCFDVSGVDVLDADGKSVVSSGTTGHGMDPVLGRELSVGLRSRWRVACCLQPGHRANAMRRLITDAVLLRTRRRELPPQRRQQPRSLTRSARSLTRKLASA